LRGKHPKAFIVQCATCERHMVLWLYHPPVPGRANYCPECKRKIDVASGRIVRLEKKQPAT
jgi:hypothetical protein